MVWTLSWNCRRRGIEMSLLSPGIAILFEHSEWFQPLFAGLDRRGIPYDRLLAAELSYDSRARTSQYALVVNRMSPSAYRLGAGSANSGSGVTEGRNLCRWLKKSTTRSASSSTWARNAATSYTMR